MPQEMVQLARERVRRRMARHGYKYVNEVAEVTGLAYGNLRNAITCTDPSRRLNLVDAYTLAKALRADDETVEDVIRDIVATTGDGTPDTPPEKKTKDTQGPARRQDAEEKRTGPKRVQASGRVA